MTRGEGHKLWMSPNVANGITMWEKYGNITTLIVSLNVKISRRSDAVDGRYLRVDVNKAVLYIHNAVAFQKSSRRADEGVEVRTFSYPILYYPCRRMNQKLLTAWRCGKK